MTSLSAECVILLGSSVCYSQRFVAPKHRAVTVKLHINCVQNMAN